MDDSFYIRSTLILQTASPEEATAVERIQESSFRTFGVGPW
jgi:hypothetical protein